MENAAADIEDEIAALEQEAEELLVHSYWKGNIRELKNIIERAVILASGKELTLENLPLDLQFTNAGSHNLSPSFELAHVEKMHIQKVMIHTKGNKTEAAKLLNIGLTTLYRKIEEYELS